MGPTPNIDAEDGARVPNADATEAEVSPKDPEVPEAVARRMYIRKDDIEEFGETPGVLWVSVHLIGETLAITHCGVQGQD